MLNYNNPNIVWKSKRKNSHYLDVDGHPLRVTFGQFTEYEFDYTKTNRLLFTHDGLHSLYRDSDREWNEQQDTYFYPLATDEEVALINKINAVLNQHTN